jgi:hypothetical protein
MRTCFASTRALPCVRILRYMASHRCAFVSQAVEKAGCARLRQAGAREACRRASLQLSRKTQGMQARTNAIEVDGHATKDTVRRRCGGAENIPVELREEAAATAHLLLQGRVLQRLHRFCCTCTLRPQHPEPWHRNTGPCSALPMHARYTLAAKGGDACSGSVHACCIRVRGCRQGTMSWHSRTRLCGRELPLHCHSFTAAALPQLHFSCTATAARLMILRVAGRVRGVETDLHSVHRYRPLRISTLPAASCSKQSARSSGAAKSVHRDSTVLAQACGLSQPATLALAW